MPFSAIPWAHLCWGEELHWSSAAVVGALLSSLVKLKTRSLDPEYGSCHYVLLRAVGLKVSD